MKKYLYFLLWYLALAYWFLRRPEAHGAAVIVDDGDRILLIRHNYGHRKLWGLPGGHIERGETDIVAAARELKEEVGLSISLTKVGTVRNYQDFKHETNEFFAAKYDRQPIKRQRSEIREYRWWSKSRLPKSMFPSAVDAIKLYFNK